MLGVFGGHKGALGALEVELQVVTSYHIDTRNGWNLWPLQEQPVLRTTELSLQPRDRFLVCFVL